MRGEERGEEDRRTTFSTVVVAHTANNSTHIVLLRTCLPFMHAKLGE